MKKLVRMALVSAATMALMSCATQQANQTAAQPAEKLEEKTEVVVQHPFDIEDSKYLEILEKSLVSVGNNYRMKKVLEKLRAGEEVYIAALGGSVTEGAGPKDANGKELWKLGYAYQFHKKLVAEYTPNNGANVHFDGAGLSGTPSVLGLIRYQSDIVDVLGHVPDLFIIEFCVNDGGEPMFAKAHEALIREALLANPETCVIELYSDAKSYKNSQANVIPVATYYRVPQVSIQNTVESHTSLINQDKFFDDYVHPTKEGHEIMADCLMNLVATVDAANIAEAFEVPSDYFKYPGFTNFTRITGSNDEVIINPGCFTGTDPRTQSLKKTGKGNFPQNWKKGSGEGDALTVEVNCKAFFLVYKVQGSWESEKYGTADIYVDGKKVISCEGGAANGWNNCESRLLFDTETAANHKIEVKMASGSEKLGFTVVAMGYTK